MGWIYPSRLGLFWSKFLSIFDWLRSVRVLLPLDVAARSESVWLT